VNLPFVSALKKFALNLHSLFMCVQVVLAVNRDYFTKRPYPLGLCSLDTVLSVA